MPKPKATPAQVREVLIAANCIRYSGVGAVLPNASQAARMLEVAPSYLIGLLFDTRQITVSKLREHAATLGLAPERIDQILPPNDGN